jgi:hypothetical protein
LGIYMEHGVLRFTKMPLWYINVPQKAYRVDTESKIYIQQVKETLALLTDHCVSLQKPVKRSSKTCGIIRFTRGLSIVMYTVSTAPMENLSDHSILVRGATNCCG